MFLADRFKIVNDALGHKIGDLLLQQTAERLLKCPRDVDTVARMGGDEFTIILSDIAKNARQYAEQGTGLGLSIVKSIAELIGAEVRVQSELDRGTTFDLLLQTADAHAARQATA